MTDKEHELMIMMLTHQALYIQMLIDLLTGKGIAQGDDIPAFDSVTINNSANDCRLSPNGASDLGGFLRR